jgi:serine/threonine protein kinase
MLPHSLNGVYPDVSCQVSWENGERVVCREGRLGDDGNRTAALFVLPAGEHPSSSSLDRLAHEYGLMDELDRAWAVQPLELLRDGGSPGSASHRAGRASAMPEPPQTMAGTLTYMAPEPTGRINRSIDSGSDLHSLGVTRYQMITGRLPLAASEPMEWVHCRVARKPAPHFRDPLIVSSSDA